jgi:hypothetical protein
MTSKRFRMRDCRVVHAAGETDSPPLTHSGTMIVCCNFASEELFVMCGFFTGFCRECGISEFKKPNQREFQDFASFIKWCESIHELVVHKINRRKTEKQRDELSNSDIVSGTTRAKIPRIIDKQVLCLITMKFFKGKSFPSVLKRVHFI